MEVRTVSSSKKITVELSINVDKVEYKEDEHERNQNLKYFRRVFVIPLSDGTTYDGALLIFKNEGIFLHIDNATILSGTVSLMVSKGMVLSHCEIVNFIGESGEQLQDTSLFTKYSCQLNFIKGNYTITFEPSEDKLLQENIFNSFSLLKLESIIGQNDVKLVAKEQELEFEMSSLAKISPFFKEMFENCPPEKKVQMIDCEPQHMQVLKNILDKNLLNPEEITVGLFKFAEKFQIEPLLRICGDHFGKNIKKENMFEIALIANTVTDDHLMGKVANFFTMHPGKDVEIFLKNNPDCSGRLFQSMIHYTAC